MAAASLAATKGATIGRVEKKVRRSIGQMNEMKVRLRLRYGRDKVCAYNFIRLFDNLVYFTKKLFVKGQ